MRGHEPRRSWAGPRPRLLAGQANLVRQSPMRIEVLEDTLQIRGVKELDSAHAAIVHEAVLEAVTETVRHIEVDLSGTVFLDSCGLGTLVALRKLVEPRG